MSNPRENAKQIALNYFEVALTKAGAKWDADYTVEIEGMIDDIIEAAVAEANKRMDAIDESLAELWQRVERDEERLHNLDGKRGNY